MKKIILALLLSLSAFYSYSQTFPEGRWYLVTLNNIRMFDIGKDSLTAGATEEFQANPTAKLSHGKEAKIIEKTYKDGIFTLKVVDNDKEISEADRITIQTGQDKFPYLLMAADRYDDAGDDLMGSFRMKLISFEELESYKTLKSVDDMTDQDFIEFAGFAADLREELSKQFNHSQLSLPRHYLFSEIKYKLAALGYNPFFKINEMEGKMAKFASNPKTKELHARLLTKAAE